jgi:predicted nucleic acid-binding protein
MPGAICDSSTLIHLAKIGRLHLLREFHERILIAPAVWREVVEEGRRLPGCSEVVEGKRSGWIEVLAPENRHVIHLLRKDLHGGESETIARRGAPQILTRLGYEVIRQKKVTSG